MLRCIRRREEVEGNVHVCVSGGEDTCYEKSVGDVWEYGDAHVLHGDDCVGLCQSRYRASLSCPVNEHARQEVLQVVAGNR